MEIKITHPPLESLACINPDYQDYGTAGAGNLYVRKIYGEEHVRYLHCYTWQEEFSERKNTALWNTKIRDVKAVSIAKHLSEENSIKGTSRLLRVDPSTVRCVNTGKGFMMKKYRKFRCGTCKPMNATAL